jgi:hypothetical protein
MEFEMMDFDIGAQGNARAWLSAQPDAVFTPSGSITRAFPTILRECGSERRIAVEGYIHVGGFFPYGLIGAHYLPDGSHILCVLVNTSPATGPTYADALAAQTDNVRIGLPAEYAEAVMEATSACLDRVHLGGGKLTFDRAAHGAVGSSPMYFSKLTSSCVELVALSRGAFSEEQIRQAVQRLIF